MIATATDKQIQKLSLCKGQVAITKDSETRHDIGIPTYIADDFDNTVLGYHCALITPNPDILDGRYLNAYLNSSLAKEYFANNASGSGMRYSLSVDAIKDILLYLPSIELQRSIGHIFSDIDRKIALNREVNCDLFKSSSQALSSVHTLHISDESNSYMGMSWYKYKGLFQLFLLIRLTMTLTIVSFSSVLSSAIIRARATRVLSAIRLEPIQYALNYEALVW